MYEAREKRELFLNGERLGEEYRSIWSLFGLEPDTEYIIESLTEQGERETLTVHTKRETCTLDVRNFGAKGDGETEDTAMLQAASMWTMDSNDDFQTLADAIARVSPQLRVTFMMDSGLTLADSADGVCRPRGVA